MKFNFKNRVCWSLPSKTINLFYFNNPFSHYHFNLLPPLFWGGLFVCFLFLHSGIFVPGYYQHTIVFTLVDVESIKFWISNIIYSHLGFILRLNLFAIHWHPFHSTTPVLLPFSQQSITVRCIVLGVWLPVFISWLCPYNLYDPDKLLTYSVPQFPIYKIGITIVSTSYT